MERSKRMRLADDTRSSSTRSSEHAAAAPTKPSIVHKSLHSPPLTISTRVLAMSERILCVRPLTLLLDALIAPAIERLALIEDAFVSLPIVRLFESYGISSALLSIISVGFAALQLRRALKRQRDLTLLLLGTAWPIWRTITLPDSVAKPRRIEAFWAIFAALNAFDAARVPPHPLETGEDGPPITSTFYYRFRPVIRLFELANEAVQQRVLGRDVPARPSVFPEPLPYYRRTRQPTSSMPRLSLALRTFGVNWPIIKLMLLWLSSLNDFALANRLLAPFRSPRPRPAGRRVVTVVTLQDATPTEEAVRVHEGSPTPPPSPPRTPDVEQSGYITVTGESNHGELADAHRVWAKSVDSSVVEHAS